MAILSHVGMSQQNEIESPLAYLRSFVAGIADDFPNDHLHELGKILEEFCENAPNIAGYFSNEISIRLCTDQNRAGHPEVTSEAKTRRRPITRSGNDDGAYQPSSAVRVAMKRHMVADDSEEQPNQVVDDDRASAEIRSSACQGLPTVVTLQLGDGDKAVERAIQEQPGENLHPHGLHNLRPIAQPQDSCATPTPATAMSTQANRIAVNNPVDFSPRLEVPVAEGAAPTHAPAFNTESLDRSVSPGSNARHDAGPVQLAVSGHEALLCAGGPRRHAADGLGAQLNPSPVDSLQLEQEVADTREDPLEICEALTEQLFNMETSAQDDESYRDGLRSILLHMSNDDQPAAVWGAGSVPQKMEPSGWSPVMWMALIRKGRGRSKTLGIYNMIGYMGLSAWFDHQVQEACMKAQSSKRRAAAQPRGARTVLNEFFPDLSEKQRRSLVKDVSRGRRLHRLVNSHGIGILIYPNIWTYIKCKEEDIGALTRFLTFQHNVILLRLLSDQIFMMLTDGAPKVSLFLASEELRALFPHDKLWCLSMKYGSEEDPLPSDCLENTTKSFFTKIEEDIGDDHLEDDDHLVVKGEPVPIQSLHKLRSGEGYSDVRVLQAVLNLSVPPSFVQIGAWVDLEEENAFSSWRNEIEKEQDKAIFLCLVRIDAAHTTLLEFNKSIGQFHHYDSHFGNYNRSRRTKTTVQKMLEEAFKPNQLPGSYHEKPSPQSKDVSNSGLLALRNACLRMHNEAVGAEDKQVELDRSRLAIAHALEQYVDCHKSYFKPRRSKRLRVA